MPTRLHAPAAPPAWLIPLAVAAALAATLRLHAATQAARPASPLPILTTILATAPVRPPLQATADAPAPPPPLPGSPAAEVAARVADLARPGARRAMEGALSRMGRYHPLVTAALAAEGLPDALRYVAVVESGYHPRAVSHAGAVGLWQFMPATARAYGLEVSPWVDERRDPVRSTHAAARHLRDLHARFGSWHLALAAYNAGAGRVDGALRRSGGSTTGEARYWAARAHLPAETRAYVPLVLAAAEAGRAPTALGLQPRPAPPLSFREVWVAGGTPLSAVARTQEVPLPSLLDLNPHLVREATPPGRRWPVRLPVEGR